MHTNFFLGFAFLSNSDGTHPVDQQVMVEFYNSLDSTGTLTWDTTRSLCKQQGLTCESGKVVML